MNQPNESGVFSPDELDDMVDELNENNRIGETEAARKLRAAQIFYRKSLERRRSDD